MRVPAVQTTVINQLELSLEGRAAVMANEWM